MDGTIGNVDVITLAIGLSSSIVDNVPLVAAAQGMYPLATFPTDHRFWLFLAYCAGDRRQHPDHRLGSGYRGDGNRAHHLRLVLASDLAAGAAGYAAGALVYLAKAAV